jgi:hypothetical protein
MWRLLGLLAALAVFTPRAGQAQAADVPSANETRYVAAARLEAYRQDAMRLGAPLSVPATRVSGNYSMEGALVGSAVGIGAALLLVSNLDNSDSGGSASVGTYVGASLLGALVLGTVGLLIGSAIHK